MMNDLEAILTLASFFLFIAIILVVVYIFSQRRSKQ